MVDDKTVTAEVASLKDTRQKFIFDNNLLAFFAQNMLNFLGEMTEKEWEKEVKHAFILQDQNSQGMVTVVPQEFSLGEYSPTKQKEQDFKKLVEASSVLTITDFSDKEQVQLVTASERNLRELRIQTDKDLKSLRSAANQFSKDCIDVSKKLIGTIQPEEKRLKELLDQVKIEKENAKLVKEKEKRKENLEAYKESLADVGANPLTDEEILGLDEKEFFAYLESEKIRITTLKQDFQGRILNAKNLEELGLVEENITVCGYSEFNESLKNRAKQLQEKLDLEIAQQKIKDEQKKLDDEKLKIEREKEVEAAAKKAREEAELKAKNDAEAARLKVIEDAKIAKEKADNDAKQAIENEKIKHNCEIRKLEINNLGIREFIAKSLQDEEVIAELSDEEWEKEKQEALNQKKQKDVEEEKIKQASIKAKQEQTEKNEKYKNWLIENGTSIEEVTGASALKSPYFVEQDGNTFTLLKKISTITI